ncbi:70-kilodalton heat shock protein [Phytophthora ramorum]
MVVEPEKYTSEDETNMVRIEAKTALTNYAYEMRNSLNDTLLEPSISEAVFISRNSGLDVMVDSCLACWQKHSLGPSCFTR